MAHMTTPISLDAALAFHTLDDGGLSAPVPGHFSNGPSGMAPEKGFPFGGLLAALCAQSMRRGLSLTAPLRTLSVQYLSAARFGEQVAFRPRLLRGGAAGCRLTDQRKQALLGVGVVAEGVL